MRITLRGARVLDAELDLPHGTVTIADGQIVAVGAANAAVDDPGRIVQADGMVITPGFIDVHTHGGGGFSLQTTAPDQILSYARWVARSGVSSFLIGVVGAPGDLPEPQIQASVAAIERWHAEGDGSRGAEPLGIHLEGPYISELRRGAHPPAWLRKPNPAETERILALAGAHLRLITVAPELPGAIDLIRRMVAAGVTVSMGHTDATFDQAQEAIRIGVTHVTHCYNAMRQLRHRDPGPLGAVAQAPQVAGEVIADGIHVHPAMVEVLVKLLGSQRTIVITDALAGAGGGDSAFDFGGQAARVEAGAARLADGTLTGSVLTMDQALRNVAALTGLTLAEAVGMLTRNPARAAGAESTKGRLLPGYDADLALLDADLRPCATFCRGQIAYADEQWTARLARAARAPQRRK